MTRSSASVRVGARSLQPQPRQNATQWGLVFAASVVAVLPVIVVFLVFQKYFVQGLTSGAVKG